MSLTDADVLYIRDSPDEDLREEFQYTSDEEYKRALAHELLKRSKASENGGKAL